MTLDDHLFRHESGRMVAALTRIFGVHNLALAEDVVQDAFCRALEVWPFRGIPDNPAGWLMQTAKHRALDVLRRERTARRFAPELGRLLESEWTLAPIVEECFRESIASDDLLRMMFSCCHPRLPEEAQVALILNILCGFGAREIAAAFLMSDAAMHKRIARAKKTLAGSKRLFDLQDADFPSRLTAVLRALYLLFNEGYHGASAESAIRAELCHEAIRLVRLLVAHPSTATPAMHALGALMCLHAARLPARLKATGELSQLDEQDRSRWDGQLLAEGYRLLDAAAAGGGVTEYHVEAAIAGVHANAQRIHDTDWPLIVDLYDKLLTMRPSPVIALNRAIAVAQAEGPQRGLDEIHSIADGDRLADYPFYHAALGELERRLDRCDLARQHFAAALEHARNPMERRFFEQRLEACVESFNTRPPG